MRIITLEEHITTPDIVKAAQMPMGAAAPAFMQAMNAKLLDVGEGRIADMDAAGIDVQVLSLSANAVDKLDSATANAAGALTRTTAWQPPFGRIPTALPPWQPWRCRNRTSAASGEFDRCVRRTGLQGRDDQRDRQRPIS